MNLKSEKGYAGVDIAISIVVLFIFVSLIAILIYNFNSSASEIQLKSQATDLAVQEIEKLKNELNFEEIKNMINEEYIKREIQTGFFETVVIQDYSDINTNKIPGMVKKITVKIQYMFKGKEQTIELSTLLSKEI